MNNIYRYILWASLLAGGGFLVSAGASLTTPKVVKHKDHTAGQLKDKIAGHLEQLGHLLARCMQRSGANVELMLLRMRELLSQDSAGMFGQARHKELVDLEHALQNSLHRLTAFEHELADLYSVLQGRRGA